MATTSGRSARPTRIGTPVRRAQIHRITVATRNRRNATVSGGISSVAQWPATHVPAKRTAMTTRRP